MRTARPASHGLNSYPVGLNLKNRGKADDARRYLKTAIDLRGVYEWGTGIAAIALRGLGDDKKAGEADDTGVKPLK